MQEVEGQLAQHPCHGHHLLEIARAFWKKRSKEEREEGRFWSSYHSGRIPPGKEIKL